MSHLTTPDGVDPLAHRAEMTNEYAERAFDMIKSTWTCSGCGAEVPSPPALVVPFANYRTLAQAAASVAQAANGALADGAGHDPCARCGAPSRLASADLFFYCSAVKSDLVARHAPGAAPSLFIWSLATGVAPFAPPPDLDRFVARDAIIRTLAAHREEEDANAGMALLREAITVIPGDSELLKFMPWVNRTGDLDLSAAIADAHVRARPDDAPGYYWKAQAIVEAVGNNRAPKAKIDEAVPLLERALQLRADYPDAQIGLANVSRIRGRDDDAERALRALIANHPNHPEGNYTLGLVLLPKNPAEALACFERGEKEAPNDADYPRSRARALVALNRMDEAKVAINRARELAPNDRRIDQVASQIVSSTQKTMTWIVRGIVALVFLGVIAIIGWTVKGALGGKGTSGHPPAGARPGKHRR